MWFEWAEGYDYDDCAALAMSVERDYLAVADSSEYDAM